MGGGEETPNETPNGVGPRLSRRSFLSAGAALAGAGALLDAPGALAQGSVSAAELLAGAGIAELQALMQRGVLTSLQLVQCYLERIARIDRGLGLRSVLELNPDAERIARALDRERARTSPRGLLHGIPILVKDNIDTGDRMQTTAGSLGLVGRPAPEDATVVAQLRRAGAVILGKTNLSEWANFRGYNSSSGWSGVGGQTSHPFVLDRNPSGSSSGSAVAVVAGLAAAALATETNGSIVCPASACGVVGIKPTVGLTSRAGVVPIARTQDTVGAHGRTVADAAAVLSALTGVDPRDPRTAESAGRSFRDYVQFVNPDGLRGARLGVPRRFFGASLAGPVTAETDAFFENALGIMEEAGATVVDYLAIRSFDEFLADDSEIKVLVYEFKRDLNAYLATRRGVPITDLESAIRFNEANSGLELAYFGQEYMRLAAIERFKQDEYEEARVVGRRIATVDGLDDALTRAGLDALVVPTGSPAWATDLVTGDSFLFSSSSYSAMAGYPIVTVPMGYTFELPLGLSFLGSAWSEPKLITLASGFEAAANLRRCPRYLRTTSDVTRARLRGDPNAPQAPQLRPAKPAYLDEFGNVVVPQLPQPPVEPVRRTIAGIRRPSSI